MAVTNKNAVVPRMSTAIRAPSPDIANHQIVLTQLKEIAEIAQRQRGNPTNSFVTLGELVAAGVIKYNFNVVSPNLITTGNAAPITTVGPAGPSGSSGKAGLQGVPGVAGTAGKQGVPGPAGSGSSGLTFAQASVIASLRM